MFEVHVSGRPCCVVGPAAATLPDNADVRPTATAPHTVRPAAAPVLGMPAARLRGLSGQKRSRSHLRVVK
ncbi:MAG: hypothetical protein IPK28_09070 [Devosia sp.]|nr:hypothetical protein [Devosia sp.]